MMQSTLQQQLALINSNLLKDIGRAELESLAWSSSDRATKTPGIVAMIQKFNQVSNQIAGNVFRYISADSMGEP